jgi:phosphate transport system permease protein
MKKFNSQKRKILNILLKAICYISSIFSMLFLLLFFLVIGIKGFDGLFTTKIRVDLLIPVTEMSKEQQIVVYNDLIYKSLVKTSKIMINKSELNAVISLGAPYQIYDQLINYPEYLGHEHCFWISASANVYKYFNTNANVVLEDSVEKLIKGLIKQNYVENFFNWQFFTNSDSSEPEIAGIGGSILGSLMMISICICFAFPLGLVTAIYLEEFAPKSFITKIIEININNLAAVPSIVFGLLGITIFIAISNLPRSSALVGGLTLAILILPIIVSTTRQAFNTVPISIKDAALALGASKLQIIFHHSLPIALPTIVTGTILAISRALGETAPLIIIGMAAFITKIPNNIFDPATALPVQIYLWADNPDGMFTEKAALAIVVLLLMLSVINFIAILVRKKYSVKLN